MYRACSGYAVMRQRSIERRMVTMNIAAATTGTAAAVPVRYHHDHVYSVVSWSPRSGSFYRKEVRYETYFEVDRHRHAARPALWSDAAVAAASAQEQQSSDPPRTTLNFCSHPSVVVLVFSTLFRRWATGTNKPHRLIVIDNPLRL